MKTFLKRIALTLLATLALWPAVAVKALDSTVPPATSPAECGTKTIQINGKQSLAYPPNCLFLEEPIGGKPNFDLYVVDCGVMYGGKPNCEYSKWSGGSVAPNVRGPIQAILSSEAGKEYQGPFGLLYSYLGLIYNYMSGIILGFSVLLIVFQGVKISVSADKADALQTAKGRIVAALVGILIWFTASLILYTINPTFFSF